ncbi:MAG: hypothetical protein WC497_02640 [Patescibacteria group bacterium]
MKKPSTIISFIVIIVLSVVLGAWLFSVGKAKTDQSDHVSVNQAKTNTVWRTDGQTAGGTRYVSEQYDFSLTLPASFSNSVEPAFGQEKLGIRFSRPNANTNEQPNRDTPDGFNTSADDRIYLRVFTNPDHLAATQGDMVRAWINEHMPSELSIKLFENRMFGGNAVIFTHQENGIAGAIGQYIYFFSTEIILVIDSGDVPQAELQAIAATVSIGQE